MRKETISSRVSAILRDAILRGVMAPGSRINLDRLREEHDVSISPLREAVTRLVADGLVEFEDQRGYRVAPVSAQNLAEVTELRATLEVMALEASIAHGDLEWESDVMRALYRLGRAGGGAGAPETWESAHTEFHMALIRGCGMPLLQHFCAVLLNMAGRYRRLFPSSGPADRDVQAEHEAMASLAIARNAGSAAGALREHVLRTGEDLQARLAVRVASG